MIRDSQDGFVHEIVFHKFDCLKRARRELTMAVQWMLSVWTLTRYCMVGWSRRLDGIQGGLANWINNGLYGRTQRGIGFLTVTSGMLQGFVLGLMLFVIYIYDLGDNTINVVSECVYCWWSI